jgi:ATP-binding cassette subfamily B protein
MSLAKTFALFFPMMMVFTNAGLAIVIWLGGRLTILGGITTGDFVAFTSYLNLLTWPMMAMGWVTNLIQRGAASMRRINNILEEVPEITDAPHSCYLPKIHGKISVRNLTFRYPGQSEDALEEIRMDIEAGETMALVGPVGSGKSTLVQTLPRLFDVSPSTVLLDGRDILEIPLKVLRGSIGFVTQEAFIFSDTIRNNVLFGRGNISEEQLQLSLEAACISEEILTLERGLDTLLGERGITLSGGQRQRLTIARALISDPPILILDDALSMVDAETEEKILDHILSLRRQKTTLLVSHRISAIRRADRISFLERGRLLEQGKHEELLEKKGFYAKLYEKQLLAQELDVYLG